MIPSQQEHSLWIIDFDRVNKEDALNREGPSVHIVSEKEVLGDFGVSSYVQQLH
jgi:hypothetical protein